MNGGFESNAAFSTKQHSNLPENDVFMPTNCADRRDLIMASRPRRGLQHRPLTGISANGMSVDLSCPVWYHTGSMTRNGT